jgi:hypothetical protein
MMTQFAIIYKVGDEPAKVAYIKALSVNFAILNLSEAHPGAKILKIMEQKAATEEVEQPAKLADVLYVDFKSRKLLSKVAAS